MIETTTTLQWDEFGYKVHLVCTDSLIASRVSRNKIIGHDYKGGSASGLCSAGKGKNEAWIFLPHNATQGTVAHEALHAVCRLMGVIDTKLNQSTEEIFAYNMGYIVDEYQDVAKRWRAEKRKQLKDGK